MGTCRGLCFVNFPTIFRGIAALTLEVFKMYYERTTMLAHR